MWQKEKPLRHTHLTTVYVYHCFHAQANQQHHRIPNKTNLLVDESQFVQNLRSAGTRRSCTICKQMQHSILSSECIGLLLSHFAMPIVRPRSRTAAESQSLRCPISQQRAEGILIGIRLPLLLLQFPNEN